VIAAPHSQPRRSSLALILLPLCLAAALSAGPQQPGETVSQPDRATAYYHYTLAHLYQQLAAEHMRREYLSRAVEEYQAAIKADPESDYIRLKLIELYASFNRLDDAVTEAQKILADDPGNVEVRRMLGKFYAQYAFDPRGSVDQGMLNSAIEQFEKILDVDAADQEALLQLSALYSAAQNPSKAEGVLKKLLEVDPGSSRGLTSLGFLYLNMGDPQRAVGQFEKVRELGQADQRALAGLAQAYEQAGENAKAAEIYRELIDEGGSGGNTLRARQALANSLLRAGRYDEALEQYQILAGAEPQNAENHLRLSQIYREKRRFDDARASLQKAAALATGRAQLDIKYNLVMLLESEGKTAEAIEALEQLIKDTEQDRYSPAEKRTRAGLYEQLGVLNRSQDRLEPAVEAFRAMAEADEESRPMALVSIVDTYRYARDYDKALERSKAAVEEFPKSRPVVSMRATVLAETGDAAAGAQSLRKLLDGGEQDRDIYLSLAQIYEKGKMYDKAVEAAQSAEKLAKTDREKIAVWFTYGSVLERAKKFDEAEAKFNQVLQLDPDNAATLNYLGYMLADLNRRVDDAHDMIQKALDLDPDNGAYLDSLGWVYYRQERFELAERLLVRSLEQFKQDPVVHSHLGDVYYKLGRTEQAREHWRRSLEEWERGPKADRDSAQIKQVRDKLGQLEARMSSASTESKEEAVSKP
jgi:tetratricopeptide (TPR) repeat protein